MISTFQRLSVLLQKMNRCQQEDFRIDFEGAVRFAIPNRQRCLFNWSVLLSLPQGHRPCTPDVTVTNEQLGSLYEVKVEPFISLILFRPFRPATPPSRSTRGQLQSVASFFFVTRLYAFCLYTERKYKRARCNVRTSSTVSEGDHFHFSNMSSLATCQFSCPFPSISTLFALYLSR